MFSFFSPTFLSKPKTKEIKQNPKRVIGCMTAAGTGERKGEQPLVVEIFTKRCRKSGNKKLYRINNNIFIVQICRYSDIYTKKRIILFQHLTFYKPECYL